MNHWVRVMMQSRSKYCSFKVERERSPYPDDNLLKATSDLINHEFKTFLKNIGFSDCLFA